MQQQKRSIVAVHGLKVEITRLLNPSTRSVMKAMILAAGFGVRMRPLTRLRPKPLFPVLNRPIIDILIRQLKKAGCEAVIVNTHHLASLVSDHVAGKDYGIGVRCRFEPVILGTGGGIKNVEDFWDTRPFIVINSDILSDIDIHDAYRFHLTHDDPATLILHDFPEFNNVWVDRSDRIIGFHQSGGAGCASEPFRKLAFTGIQIVDPDILDFIPEGTFSSSIDAYDAMLAKGLKLRGHIVNGHYWQDMGSIRGYRRGVRDLLLQRCLIPDIIPEQKETCCGKNLVMGEKSRLRGWNLIGDNLTCEKDCIVSRSIIWDNVLIREGVAVKDSIVADEAIVSAPASGKVIV